MHPQFDQETIYDAKNVFLKYELSTEDSELLVSINKAKEYMDNMQYHINSGELNENSLTQCSSDLQELDSATMVLATLLPMREFTQEEINAVLAKFFSK